MDWNFVG